MIEGVYFSETDEGKYSGFRSIEKNIVDKEIKDKIRKGPLIELSRILLNIQNQKIKDRDKALEKEIKDKIRISKPERIFNKITPDNVIFVGNNGFKIKTKNPKKKYRYPDFKIKGQNKVIEIFGIYYHDLFKIKNGKRIDDPKDLIKEYKEVGYDCLVFWEYEIIKTYEKRKEYPKPDLKKLLKKTLKFIEQGSI